MLLVVIPVLLAVQQARAQGDTVCVGSVSTWQVVDVPGDSYTWELYNDVAGINLAVVPGNCPATEAYFVGGVNTGDSVNVMCLEPGVYFIKVTAVNGCPTNNLKLGKIVVEECIPEICQLFEIDPFASISEGTLIIACRPNRAEKVVNALSARGIKSSIAGEFVNKNKGMILIDRGNEKQLRHPLVDPFWHAFYNALQQYSTLEG